MENLIPSVIAFAAGIAWSLAGARHLPPQPWLVVAGLALTILATHRIGDRRLAFSLLLPFFFLLGSLRAIPYLTPPDNDPGHIAGQVDKRRELTISGILKECPTSTPDRSRLLISCEQLIRADGTTLPTHGLVRLSMPFLLPADLEPGDRLLAKAILNRPKSSGTPGAFDYREFLARQSIWVTGWVESPTLIQKVHVLSRPMAERIRYLPERLRHRTGGFLDQTLPPRNSGLYRALLIGDRSTLPPDLSENFTAVGAVHLLAISGMHMGLIALMTTFVIGWLLKRSTKLLLRLPAWKVAGLLAIPPLAGYAMIAGLQIPAVRALVMTVVFLIAILIDRQWSIPVNIALAAFLLLAWRPTILGNAAFQLSFAAVIAIALLYPQASKLLTDTPGAEETLSLRLRRWLVGGLAISIAASIGTLPLLLVHFNRVSLLSPLSTLLLEPFLCGWALCIGLWGCMLIPISAPLAAITLQLGSLGLKAADRLSAALAKLPGISFRLPT
ncbi:MAG: ComEC family competence protein, partial [Desulfobulbaceae bacterium]|nr:ComEC family competence protein [Desulfobulbaceae bacterium]